MHIATGGITASMDDAPLPVRGLAAEQNLARFIAVERRAQIDELAQPRRAVRDGARELDMVIPIGALKSGDHKTVFEDIRLLAEVAREGRAKLKVIIETALLTDEEKVAACVISKRARANFVKTSTGFAKGGATAEDVALMARAVEHKLEVKASGGVRSMADAKSMVEAGATRIGASVGVKIAQEEKSGVTAPANSSSGGGGY